MGKTGVILLSMGGPEKLDDIKEYLYNIFSDRLLIQLPGGSLFQKPFAKLISSLRYKKVQAHYELIGGSSPLLKWTKSQAVQIEKYFQNDKIDLKCYIGMRYFHPYIDKTVKQAIKDGCKRLIVLPLYPQFSLGTTGSSIWEIKKVISLHNDIETIYIDDFHDDTGYIDLLKDYIEQNINENDILLFSAHSIPEKFVKKGDPYVDRTKLTASKVAGVREHFVTFQSRTGPVEWVGPDTVETVRELLHNRKGNIFIVPISFVCDHIETMYEIDIELKSLVDEKHRDRIKRMPMFNDDKKFAMVLSNIIKSRM